MASKLNLDSLPVQWVSTSRIQPNRYNPSSPSLEIIEAIVKDVKRHGSHAIDPILVRKLTHRGFELINGEKRWRAFRKLRISKIACRVSMLDEASARSLAYRQARERGEIDAFKEAELFVYENEKNKKTYEQIAEDYVVTKAYVAKRVSVLNIAPRIRRMLPRGNFPPSMLEAVASVRDPRNQEELLQAIGKFNLTVHEAENRATWLNEARIVPKSAEEASDDEASKVEKDLERGLQIVRDQGLPVDRELLRDSQGGESSFDLSDGVLIERVQSVLSCVEFSAKGIVDGKPIVLDKAELTVQKVLDRRRLEELLYVYI